MRQDATLSRRFGRAFGGYIIAPGLAVAAIVALGFAWKEDEFRTDVLEALEGTQTGSFGPES